jgi:hypothetical protein
MFDVLLFYSKSIAAEKHKIRKTGIYCCILPEKPSKFFLKIVCLIVYQINIGMVLVLGTGMAWAGEKAPQKVVDIQSLPFYIFLFYIICHMKRKCQESDPMTHLNPAYIQELMDIVNQSPFPDHMRMQLS